MNDTELRKLGEYRAMLRVNKHRLDDALETQASDQEAIAEQVGAMAARMIEAKEDLAKIEARLTEDFRAGERTTKEVVEAKVRRSPERERAWVRYQSAVSDHAKWDALLDAWKARGKDIHALGRLFGDQYFAMTSVSGAERQRYSADAYVRPNTRRQRAE